MTASSRSPVQLSYGPKERPSLHLNRKHQLIIHILFCTTLLLKDLSTVRLFTDKNTNRDINDKRGGEKRDNNWKTKELIRHFDCYVSTVNHIGLTLWLTEMGFKKMWPLFNPNCRKLLLVRFYEWSFTAKQKEWKTKEKEKKGNFLLDWQINGSIVSTNLFT